MILIGETKDEKLNRYEKALKEANDYIKTIDYSELPEGFRKVVCRGIIEYENIVRGMKNDYL